MDRLIKYIFVGLIVSLYYFSFGFNFLPKSFNTKLLLAVIGVIIAAYDIVASRKFYIDYKLLGAISLAVVFSLICLIAVDYNYTSDYSYASYIISFSVWCFGAYTVCSLIKNVHGEVNLKLLTYYLAAVCFVQCCLALIIDYVPIFQLYVDRYIYQDQEFLTEVKRLYGIGASLDNAGVRFSIVLLLISGILSKELEVLSSSKTITLLMLAFFTIIVIGNMISRTTSIGGMLALGYLLWNTRLIRTVIRKEYFKFYFIFISLLAVSIVATVYFYHTSEIFYSQIRFAFEGFFNWIEYGEWRTDSTDKLNRNMWIWPTDLQTWLIGTGKFDNWVFGTDIGYCRFILYCGLPGFVVFSLFFVYNSFVFIRQYPQFGVLFLILLALTFIIWIKVSTDLFIIYALLYVIEIFREDKSLHLK